jgi:RHS repeat-associated protein
VLGPNPQIDQTTNRFLTSEGYIYDEAGNLRQEPGKSYKYDAESRLTEFNNGSALYFYDGDGRRVKKAAGTDVTVFVYNIAGQLVAEYRNTPVELGGGTSFVTLDHLGSIRMITHLSGDIKSRHDYLPFGEELTVGRTAQNYYLQADGLNQKFTGKERDEESGLDYFGARYYSSATGRFTAVDPGPFAVADPQSFNRFVYVQNNPLKFIDPTGRALYITGQYADEVVRMLERATGYTLHRDPKTGQVTVVSGTKRKEEKTSKSLAQKLGAVIDDDAKVNVNTVKDGSDREGNGIFIDDFKSRTVDVADLNKIIEEGHFDFAAVSLGHVLEEYFHAAKTGSEDFDSAHEKGLEFEGQVLSDFTNKTEGKPSEIQGRMNPAFTPGAVRVETHKFIYSSVLYDVVLKVSIKTFDVPTGKVSYDRSVKSIEKKDK